MEPSHLHPPIDPSEPSFNFLSHSMLLYMQDAAMNSVPYSPKTLSPYHMHNTALSTSFLTPNNLQDNLQDLQDTLDLAKAMKKELEILVLSRENVDDASLHLLSKWLQEKKMSLEMQESCTLEAANALVSKLKSQIEPFAVLTSQTSSWEEKSAVAKLSDKMNKNKRNKMWRKRKRKSIGEMRAKERERFDIADQEADEWRAREIARDIAKHKVEKMKQIARAKANEDRKRLESELELALMVEKLQELRSIRIQKLKKQGHFLPEEDDKFLERVRATVEEEERQAAAAADTDAAKDAIATAEESRKTINSGVPDMKVSIDKNNGETVSQGQVTESDNKRVSDEATELKSEQRGLDGKNSARAYDSVANLPLEFYHYYHGSNTDIGTLIEVRRTWDQYIRPGGSRIPGNWVQPPPPANEIWASYLVEHKDV